MSRILDSFGQTLRAVMADQSVMMVMIGAIILYSFFYPAAYRHQVASDMPIIVVDQDNSATSRELLRRIEALRATRIAGQATTIAQAQVLMEAGDAEGIVYIPHDLERDILRGGSGRLVLLGDGGYLSRASTVLNGLSSAITHFARGTAAQQAVFMGAPQASPLTLEQRPLYNTAEGYGSSVVTGVSLLIVHQTLLLGIGTLLGTRRKALGRRLHFDLPVLGGMVLAFVLIGLFGVLYYSGFAFWVQDYPRGGNLPGLLLAGPLFVLATVMLGLCLGSVLDCRERGFQYITASSIVLFFLSNLSWPDSVSPPALVALAKLLPSTAGINAMVRLNQMGVSVREVSGEICNLLVLVVLYGGIALWRFRPMPAIRQGASW